MEGVRKVYIMKDDVVNPDCSRADALREEASKKGELSADENDFLIQHELECERCKAPDPQSIRRPKEYPPAVGSL